MPPNVYGSAMEEPATQVPSTEGPPLVGFATISSNAEEYARYVEQLAHAQYEDENPSGPPKTVWQPHPGFQELATSLHADELLIGGAAGPGKTDCLIYGSLAEIDHPATRVLFLRRTFGELREVMDRTLTVFPQLGATWRESEKRWRFPSGATFEFGYTADADVLMADGTYRHISQIRIGDMVQTLEGPRRVTNWWAVPPKQTVKLVVAGQSAGYVSLSHPLLGVDGHWENPRARISAQESNVRSADTAFRASNPAGTPLPPLTVPLLLHGLGPQSGSSPAAWGADGAADGWRPSPVPDSLVGCRTGFRSGDAPVLIAAGVAPARTPSPADAGTHAPTPWHGDGQRRTPAHSPLVSARYCHLYTKEWRTISEAVHQSEIEIRPADVRALWDMTVEGANHYITRGGVVNGNCETFADATRYQGQEYTRINFDELGQVQDERIVDFLLTRLRTTATDYPVRPMFAASANPGGAGHAMLKRRYVDPTNKGTAVFIDPNNGLSRAFIPGKVSDNPSIKPEYIQRLMGLPPIMRRQLLDGDWEAGAGAALDELDEVTHIMPAFQIPAHWPRYAGFDWGFRHPWWFIAATIDPDGDIYVYDCIWGRQMLPGDIAQAIQERYEYQPWQHIAAGHDVFHSRRAIEENTPTIAESFLAYDLILEKANIHRVLGLNNCRALLAWRTIDRGSAGRPRLRFFDTPRVRRLVSELKVIVTNPDNPEDSLKVNAHPDSGEGGDDAYDCFRYLCATRIASGASEAGNAPLLSTNDPSVLRAEYERLYRRRGSIPTEKLNSLNSGFNSWEIL